MEITKPCRCSGGVQPRELGTVALSALLVAAPFVDRRDERRWRKRPVALSALLVAAPFVDRRDERRWRKRPVALASPLRSCWRSSCSH
jgi:hypothetical protein